jgi:hypothetical protein
MRFEIFKSMMRYLVLYALYQQYYRRTTKLKGEFYKQEESTLRKLAKMTSVLASKEESWGSTNQQEPSCVVQLELALIYIFVSAGHDTGSWWLTELVT